MRTTTVVIAGKERVLCFSTFVVKACTDRYGDVSKIDEALTNEKVGEVLEEALWIMSQMMIAGAKYCDMMGVEHEPPLTAEELSYVCDISDFEAVTSKIRETITVSSASDVEVEAKNVEATPIT